MDCIPIFLCMLMAMAEKIEAAIGPVPALIRLLSSPDIITWFMLFPNRWRHKFKLDYQFFEVAYITSTDKIGKKWMW